MTNQPESSQYLSTRLQGQTGVIELDRPKALNSLDEGMINGIQAALDQWQDDDSVSQILIRSTSSRAFCAGGDVRAIAEADAEGHHESGDEFFRQEYALNYAMSQYNKPIVAVLEGVVMGGGFGISAHGSHRIVTRTTLGAMPEAAIGFVPDVGMTYRLTHLRALGDDVPATLPDATALGVFLGTTGWRMSAADMLALGLATHVVEDAAAFGDAVIADGLVIALEEHAVPASAAVRGEAGTDDLGSSRLVEYAGLINDIFSGETWVDIAEKLEHKLASVTAEGQVQFLKDVAEALKPANPTSLVAITEILHYNARVDLKTALDNELVVGSALRRQPNFPEGIRAVLVDKDRNPKFTPADAREVGVGHWRSMLRG